MTTLQAAPTSAPRLRQMYPRGLAAYAWCVLAFMVAVILWGAVVRATSSGAGCGNHWPLCNGEFFPHHPRLATVIEFTHRSMTGVLTSLVVVLAVWTRFATPRLHPARKAVAWVVVLLITEALLGALLVKGGYVEANTSTARVIVQCIHFTNTMALLAALTLTAWRLTVPAIFSPNHLPNARMRRLACVAVLSTVLTGATGSVAALADTLFPSPNLRAALAQDFNASAPLLVHMRWMHPAAALLSVVFAGWLALRLLPERSAKVVLALSLLQIVLGGLDVLLLAPTWMQIVHLLGADLFWIALVVVSSEALTKFSSTNKLI